MRVIEREKTPTSPPQFCLSKRSWTPPVVEAPKATLGPY